jgi:NADPH-dependent ferric siderophore reductase
MTTPRRNTMTTLRVVRTEQLTPRMVRVIFGGPQLATFAHAGFTDSYVKLLFLDKGIDYPEPFDIQRIRAEYPRDQWPAVRTYTVRWLDRDAGELAIDFVTHGSAGIAGPWAMSAAPGTEIMVLGPGGAYVPREDVDRHLLIGDESALPAISAAVEALPADAVVEVLVEVADSAEEQPLHSAAETTVTWVHRDGATPGLKLVEAARELKPFDGTVQAFVHGETAAVKEVRGLLRTEHGVPRELSSISGYWRLGMNEDGFQRAKGAEAAAEKVTG